MRNLSHLKTPKKKKSWSTIIMFGMSIGLPLAIVVMTLLWSDSVDTKVHSSVVDPLNESEESLDKNLLVAEQLQFAMKYMEEGKWEEMAKVCENAINVDPTISYSYALLGNAMIMMNQYSTAAETLRKATKLEPDNYNYLYHLGFALSQSAQDQVNKKKRYQLNKEAIATFDNYLVHATIHNVPADQISMAHTHLAGVYRDVKTSEYQTLALENFQHALEHDESNELAVFNIGVMYAEKYGKTNLENDREIALLHIEKAIAMNPKNAQYAVIKDTLMGKVNPNELMSTLNKMEL